ncbi:hypothetical protein RF55_14378 [Lasius niger]|uniref:Uncharacterized protein n=1 Tax=Lasius niger TaxID=67767 RepID=A0A0J7K8S7_LASNI|nr:hypothetical protein RF55_14378 [Lasius niger]
MMSNLSVKYHVVEFEDGLEIVPSSWVKENMCKYPAIKSKKKKDKAVINNVQPDSSWKNYAILRTFAVCDTYEEACLKCDKAEYVSDLNTDMDDNDKENNFVQELNTPKQRKIQNSQVYKSSFEAPQGFEGAFKERSRTFKK